MSGAKLQNDPPTEAQTRAASKYLQTLKVEYARTMVPELRDSIDVLCELARQPSIAKLRAALDPLRHMRVRHDGNYAEADCEILNMVNGVQCVVGYARSGTEANEFDEIFERVREALK